MCGSKWATAIKIKGYGSCDEYIDVDCSATDVCASDLGIFFTYNDYNLDFALAHACLKKKCHAQWTVCDDTNPGYDQGCHFPNGLQELQGEC